MLERDDNAAAITMCIPFKHSGVLCHSMLEEDRLNKSSTTFPVALAFGDRDFFASSRGGEDILKACKKHNGNRVNLFKMP